MKQWLRGAAIAAVAACVGMVEKAEATTVRYEGVFSSGIDSFGAFGPIGASLVGRTFNLIFSGAPDVTYSATSTYSDYTEIEATIYVGGKSVLFPAIADFIPDFTSGIVTTNDGSSSSRTDRSGGNDDVFATNDQGVSGQSDGEAIASISTASARFSLDPAAPIYYAVQPSDTAFGHIRLNFHSSDTVYGTDIDALDIFSVQVSDTALFPVPLPPALPMFGAAVLAFGVFSYGLKRKCATAA